MAGEWWNPSTYFAAATSAASSAWTSASGLFTTRTPVVSGGNADDALGLYEPSDKFDVVDYDPSESYDNVPGNQGCPRGYFIDYIDGEKVCRRVRYATDANGRTVLVNNTTAGPTSGESFWQTAGKVADTLAAPFKGAKDNAENFSDWFKKHFGGGLLSGAYAIVAILVVVGILFIVVNRALQQRGI